MAESAVKMAKMLLKKAEDSHSDPQMAFLDYRNTPLQELNASPAQLLMGRRTRTTLPTSSELLQPKTVDVSDKRKEKRLKTMYYYNRQAKDLPSLGEGQSVTVRPLKGRTWVKGTIIRGVDERSYDVQVGDSVLRRNRVFIRPIPSATVDNNQHEQPDTTTQPKDTSATSQTNHTPVRPRKTTKLPKRLEDFVVG